MKAVIVEDELSSLRNLQNLLGKYSPNIDVVGTAEDVESAIRLFQNEDLKIDLAFLDISLPDGLVFQVLNYVKENLKTQFDIIFITAYDSFAKKACEYACLGYINKPIDPDELVGAVSRVRTKRDLMMPVQISVFQEHLENRDKKTAGKEVPTSSSPIANAVTDTNPLGKLVIPAIDGILLVEIKDIMRLEAEDNYTHIFLRDGTRRTVAKTIKTYEGLLEPHKFFRVHKKHLINIDFMLKFVRTDSIVMMHDNVGIEVSRRRRPAFISFLHKFPGSSR